MKHTYSLSKTLLVLAGACLLSGCNATIERKSKGSSSESISGGSIDSKLISSSGAEKESSTTNESAGTSESKTSSSNAESSSAKESSVNDSLSSNSDIQSSEIASSSESSTDAPSSSEEISSNVEKSSSSSETSSVIPSGAVTVTFDLNGASGQNKSISIDAGNKISSLSVNNENEGYYFVAWCTDKNGDNPYDFNEPVTSDLTLYASWNFHVYFWGEDGASAIDTEYVAVKKDHKIGKIPECTSVPSGKSFDYWHTEGSTDKLTADTVISEPDTIYYASFTALNCKFNFYIGDDLVKTSTADSDNEYVDLPTYAETFKGNEGFKGWYTDKEEGSRFDFVDFSVVKEGYAEPTTNLYARYETIEGSKDVGDLVNAYKYKSYGAKVTEGIGLHDGTYYISLDAGYSTSDSCKYGFALYPTVFYGNLYLKEYVLNLKLGEFSDSNLAIQPRIYVLDETGNRLKNGAGELYTKNGDATASGSKNYELYDLMAAESADFDWNEDHYFQIGFEFKQFNAAKDGSTIEIESFKISNSNVDLTSDYVFDLASIEDADCDRCVPSYDEDTKQLAIINDSTSDNVDNGHYCSLTYQSLFTAKAGGTYKVSTKVGSFSSKCIEGERNIGFFIQSKDLNDGAPMHLGNVYNAGEETVIDFSDKITVDCTFTFRINFVCGESWQDKTAGYFSGEYVEISSLAFLTK
jgi:uncharacterized repeat protein (TIGR02543 family)